MYAKRYHQAAISVVTYVAAIAPAKHIQTFIE